MKKRLKTTQIAQVRSAMLIKQKGRCALCRVKIEGKIKPCLDHCHQTGHVRAVLCNNCNGIEGKIWNRANRAKRDGTVKWWLQQLLDYWNHHEENPSGVFHPTHKTEAEKREERNKKARLAYAKKKAQKNVRGK